MYCMCFMCIYYRAWAGARALHSLGASRDAPQRGIRKKESDEKQTTSTLTVKPRFKSRKSNMFSGSPFMVFAQLLCGKTGSTVVLFLKVWVRPQSSQSGRACHPPCYDVLCQLQKSRVRGQDLLMKSLHGRQDCRVA